MSAHSDYGYLGMLVSWLSMALTPARLIDWTVPER
jgi:hypothetical protein